MGEDRFELLLVEAIDEASRDDDDAFLAFLPAENALGTSVGMTASRGTGTSAIAQSRSRIGWRRIVSGPPSRSALASERARSSERYGAHASRPSAPRATGQQPSRPR